MSHYKLTPNDDEKIRKFMETLDANQHLDLPEYKDLVRSEVRKLSPMAKRFVASVFVDASMERQGKKRGQG